MHYQSRNFPDLFQTRSTNKHNGQSTEIRKFHLIQKQKKHNTGTTYEEKHRRKEVPVRIVSLYLGSELHLSCLYKLRLLFQVL
jgi:hypothetical protein